MKHLSRLSDPEQTRYGCFVCDEWFGVGEPAQIRLAEHRKNDEHVERLHSWQYEAAKRMGAFDVPTD